LKIYRKIKILVKTSFYRKSEEKDEKDEKHKRKNPKRQSRPTSGLSINFKWENRVKNSKEVRKEVSQEIKSDKKKK